MENESTPAWWTGSAKAFQEHIAEANRRAEEARVWLEARYKSADLITDPTVVEVADAISEKYDFAGWAAFRADYYIPGLAFGGHQEENPDPEQIAKFVHINVARVKLGIKDDADRFSLPISRVAIAWRRKYVEGRGRRPGPMPRKAILAKTEDWTD